MEGTVAITDYGWYEFLVRQTNLDEVNFWTPSAHWAFRGDVGSPFFFKLKKQYDHAVCGFEYFARFARLPDWLAWESFDVKNGCAVTNEHSLPALEASHIKPYAKAGPDEVRNGVLLRADLHRLFDQGYVT